MNHLQLVEQVKKMAGYGGAVEKKDAKITYYKGRFGYVLSGQGEMYTPELAQRWGKAKRAGKSLEYFVKDCAHWFGRKVVDCSGMIVEAIRVYEPGYGDRAANTFRSQFTKRGKIADMPEIPGLAVWKDGHIGIYIGNGKVIEARGYKYGVVESTLSSQEWKEWGQISGVTYSTKPAIETTGICTKAEANVYSEARNTSKVVGRMPLGAKIEIIKTWVNPTWHKIWYNGKEAYMWNGYVELPASWEVKRLLKKTSPYMKGEDVKNLQKALDRKGYAVGTLDGIFGTRTQEAVKAFQRTKKLSADGIAGKDTVTALGGKWRG